jgi:peptidoglycan/LPS O-acetylase OafA/YrhL
VSVSATSARTRRAQVAYAPGLDGLRALACIAVMLYHLGVLHVTGGFLGVTAFFTLSGFLITTLLVDERDRTGRIDLRAFWRRRAFRIIPLYWVVSFTCGIVGIATATEVGRQTALAALGSLLFVVNWLIVADHRHAGLLGSNWSVAVEEQFYLFWPLAFVVLAKRVERTRRMAIGIAIVAAVIAAYRLTVAGTWDRIWIATDTQADALLAGCAVGLGLRCRRAPVSQAALAVLVALFVLAHDGTVVSAHVLMPAATVATALALPYLQERGGLLAARPIAAVGRRSYGLYLWSAPIDLLVAHHLQLPGWAAFLAVGPGVFLVAELTYRCIERPFRRRGREPGARPADWVRVR